MFPSTENAYQAAKFPSQFTGKFLSISADASKKLAKTYEKDASKLFNSSRWEEIKYDVMNGLVFQKFNNDLILKQMLLDTKNAHLEETNSWNDVVWGVCAGVGENRLGNLLMKIRKML